MDASVAEDKMRIAIERVQDPKLVPQDKKWTVEIYKALAREFIEITQNRNAIAMLELTLQKFPMDRDAPMMQNKVAELYDELARLSPDGSAAREEYSAKALEARTRLASYVGTTPWTDANRDDPEALQRAEELVKNGLQRAGSRPHECRADLLQPGERAHGRRRAARDDSKGDRRVSPRGARMGGLHRAGSDVARRLRESLLARGRAVLDRRFADRAGEHSEGGRAAEGSAGRGRGARLERGRQVPSTGAYYIVSLAEKVLEDQYRLYDETKGARVSRSARK